MVETNKTKYDKVLRKRVDALSQELDRMEQRNIKALEVFGATVMALAGTCGEQSPQALVALQALKKAAAKKPFESSNLSEALEGFRKAMMLSPEQKQLDPGAGETGRHVAMAVLAGLHSGDEEFDSHLERNISVIAGHITKGQIRPAMTVVADIIDEFREITDRRRQEAESALHLVLGELLKTEDELAAAVVSASDKLRQSGVDSDKSITASVGRLAKEMSAAGSGKELEDLKSSVLEHVRSLREALKTRREREKELLDQTQVEVDNLREALSSTRRQAREAKKKSEMLSRQALTDPVTQILNKRALNRDLRLSLEDKSAQPVCLVVFDIDHFKEINDAYGHQAGDKALKTIADQTQASLRPSDKLFRYAGDEFVILLTRTDLDTTVNIAERVRRTAAAIKFTYHGDAEQRVTISLGISVAGPKDTPETLFARADEGLLMAKRAGRDRVQVR